jgi:uncharacterized lipoprotein YmbA
MRWLRPCLLSALLLLPSCGGFQRTSAPTVWLNLRPALPEGPLAANGPSVLILPFSAWAPFRTDRVVSRTGEDQWEFAYYHRWAANPGEIVADHLRSYLTRSGLFRAVLSAPAPFEPDYRLGGVVHALYWDRTKGEAVVELEASLASRSGSYGGFWVVRSSKPTAGQGVETFLSAASAALSDAMGHLNRDLAQALSSPPPEASTQEAPR